MKISYISINSSAAFHIFFSHHGLWAPGARWFRKLAFSAKATIISLAFIVPLIGLLGW